MGKYDPSTELSLDFYAGIGPLQLGVVLVLLPYLNSQKIRKLLSLFFSGVCNSQINVVEPGNLFYWTGEAF